MRWIALIFVVGLVAACNRPMTDRQFISLQNLSNNLAMQGMMLQQMGQPRLAPIPPKPIMCQTYSNGQMVCH